MAQIIAMYGRGRSLFEGVCVLIEHDLAEEAMILARSLFETSLRLERLAAAPAKRVGLMLGWMHDSTTRMIGLARAASKVDVELNLLETVQGLDERRRSIRDSATAAGIGKFPKFGDELALSKRFGRLEDHFSFLIGHEMTHGSQFAQSVRTQSEGEVLAIYHKQQVARVSRAVVEFAARSLLLACRSVCEVFEWPEPDSIEKMLILTGNPAEWGPD